MILKKTIRRGNIKMRVRKKIFGTKDRPRLSVFKSNINISAQLIDDNEMKTIVAFSSMNREIRESIKTKTKKEQASIVGENIAKLAIDKGVKEVVFDRNGYLYHGRIKNLAESARKEGLKF